MKCLQCSTDNNLKERVANNGRCKTCRHPFVFEPTTMDQLKITDTLFDKAIDDLSAHGMLFFTPKQLLYFLDRRVKKKANTSIVGWIVVYIFVNFFGFFFLGLPLSGVTKTLASTAVPALVISIIFIVLMLKASRSATKTYRSRRSSARALQVLGGMMLVGGIGLSLRFDSFGLFVSWVLVGMGSIYMGTRQLQSQVAIAQSLLIDAEQLQQWLTRWRLINQPIEKLLPPPQEASAPVAMDPDVTAYSFDRLVVCDTSTIAHLLIANNFHFEHNCAILSITGYPSAIFQTTMAMVRRNPDLKVYALHDCNSRGVGLMHQLRASPQWFQGSSVELFDLGLRPRQILTNPSLMVQRSSESAQDATHLPPEVRQDLSPEELTWLQAGYFVELESFSPQRLIQVLQRGISESRNLDLQGDQDRDIILAGTSDSSFYMIDSFG